jgi:hypothetical protein
VLKKGKKEKRRTYLPAFFEGLLVHVQSNGQKRDKKQPELESSSKGGNDRGGGGAGPGPLNTTLKKKGHFFDMEFPKNLLWCF